MEKIYLINGLIFQHGHIYSIAEMPDISDAVKIQTALMYASFMGVISSKDSDTTQLVGVTNDRWGEAIITDFVITDKKITFTKKYRNRKDLILYEFTHKEKDIWVGTYSGDATGKGRSHCVVTEVDRRFFDPDAMIA